MDSNTVDTIAHLTGNTCTYLLYHDADSHTVKQGKCRRLPTFRGSRLSELLTMIPLPSSYPGILEVKDAPRSKDPNAGLEFISTG